MLCTPRKVGSSRTQVGISGSHSDNKSTTPQELGTRASERWKP